MRPGASRIDVVAVDRNAGRVDSAATATRRVDTGRDATRPEATAATRSVSSLRRETGACRAARATHVHQRARHDLVLRAGRDELEDRIPRVAVVARSEACEVASDLVDVRGLLDRVPAGESMSRPRRRDPRRRFLDDPRRSRGDTATPPLNFFGGSTSRPRRRRDPLSTGSWPRRRRDLQSAGAGAATSPSRRPSPRAGPRTRGGLRDDDAVTYSSFSLRGHSLRSHAFVFASAALGRGRRRLDRDFDAGRGPRSAPWRRGRRARGTRRRRPTRCRRCT